MRAIVGRSAQVFGCSSGVVSRMAMGLNDPGRILIRPETEPRSLRSEQVLLVPKETGLSCEPRRASCCFLCGC